MYMALSTLQQVSLGCFYESKKRSSALKVCLHHSCPQDILKLPDPTYTKYVPNAILSILCTDITHTSKELVLQ